MQLKDCTLTYVVYLSPSGWYNHTTARSQLRSVLTGVKMVAMAPTQAEQLHG